MTAFSVWINQNWFSFLQSLGIVGSLLLAVATMTRDARARSASDLLGLMEQHRDLWGQLYSRPDLARILHEEVDLVAQPISQIEELFINSVIVHFHTGWLLSRKGTGNSLDALMPDIRAFFSLPIPKAVWIESRPAREVRFAKFVEKCLS